MATKSKPTLRLVRFRGEYFPADLESFRSMKESNLTVFRLPEEVLPTLKASLFRKFNVEIVPFSVAYGKVLESFQKLRLTTLDDHRWKAESNVLFLSFPHSQLEHGNQLVHELGFVLGRYGIKLMRENKKTQDSEGKTLRHIMRLTCKPDPEINPSVYWKDAIPPKEENVRLNLSSCASLVFTSRPSSHYPGRTAFGIAFEDLLGGEWVHQFSREFGVAQLDREQLVRVIDHLINVLNISKNFTPPEVKSTRNER